VNITDVEKIKNRGKQNFKDDANNKQLDKEDTQQSNLNSKYLSRTLVLNILILLCFYVSNTLTYLYMLCKVQFDIVVQSQSK